MTEESLRFTREETEELLSGDVPEEVLSEVLQTSGVSSPVYPEYCGRPPTPPEETDALGHVLMLDYDEDVSFPAGYEGETRRERVEEETRRRMEETGASLSVVLRSSRGSYHVWELGVDSLKERILEALERHADPMHAAVSKRRDKFVLRATAKRYTETGEVYKEAPEVVGVHTAPYDRIPVSSPHAEYLAALAERQDREREARRIRYVLADAPTVGDPETLEVSQYLTVTDDLKREVW